jgi:sec-independent protein translocase protein TatA
MFAIVAVSSYLVGRQAAGGAAPPADRGDKTMGSLSIWHWLVVIAVVALLFGGRGKISELMGDVAKGVKSFKKGLADDDEAPKPIESKAPSDEKTKVG